jgi:hypothetical protein
MSRVRGARGAWLVLAGLLSLGACAPPSPPAPPRGISHAPGTRRDSVNTTHTMLYTLARQVGSYGGSAGELPPTLDPILARHPQVSVWEMYPNGTDVWGRPVRYSPRRPRFELRSAGPDGVFDTRDDIVVQGRAGRDRPCTTRDEHGVREVPPPCPDEPPA